MGAFKTISLADANLSDIIDSSEIAKIKEETTSGVTIEDFPITAFKIQQKILDIKNTSSLNVGGFVNGNASISSFSSIYYVVLFSNKFEIIIIPEGGQIRKRYGYGFGFTITVTQIDTKLTFNYGIIAASATLNLARAGYELNVFGVVDAALAQNMPQAAGDFTKSLYTSLVSFIDAAKKSLSSNPIIKLYPIEILNIQGILRETSDFYSMYIGAKNVVLGLKLSDVINSIRTTSNTLVNENVVQFMYSYFDFANAYTAPNNVQKENAKKWIAGTYNKVAQFGVSHDSWVAIDPIVEDGKFVALSGLAGSENYQPHPLPNNWATSSKQIKITSSEVSTDFSSSVKIAAIGDVSGKFNVITLNKEIALFLDTSGPLVTGSKVIETRYGAGVRLTFQVSNIEFGTTISFASVGAACEMGYANVEYEITGLGISDPELLKDFPGPLDINQDTVAQIESAFNGLKNKLAVMDVAKMQPQPFMIRVSEPDKIDPTLSAQAYVYSLGKIASKIRLEDAIAQAPLGIKKDSILGAYKSLIDVSDENVRITNEQKRVADKWLGI